MTFFSGTGWQKIVYYKYNNLSIFLLSKKNWKEGKICNISKVAVMTQVQVCVPFAASLVMCLCGEEAAE